MLFLAAVILRVVTAARTAVIFADGPRFVDLAQQMSDGNWERALSHPYHPLYPLLMIVARSWAGDLETAGIACSILGGALAVVGLYLFLRDAFGSRIAWIGGLLLAVVPYAVRFSSDVQSDGVYLGFFLLGVALLWRALERGTAATALATGAMSGLAYLTRPEGVGIVVVGVVLAVGRFPGRGWSGRQLARWLAALSIGFTVLAGPYLWALASLRGGISLSGKKSLTVLLGIAESTGAIDRTSWPVLAALLALAVLALLTRWRWRSRFGSLRSPVPLAVVGVVLAAALATLPVMREFAGVVVSSLGPGIVLLIGLGLYSSRANPISKRSVFICAFLALYAVVLSALLLNYGYLSRRHALPPLALLLGYAAAGTVFLAEVLRQQLSRLHPMRKLSVGMSLALALVMVGSTELPKTLRRHRDDALAQRQAAEWLREQAMPQGRLAAVRNRTAYYANREWVRLRYRGDGRSLDSLDLGPARFLIVDREIDVSRRDGSEVEPVALVELHRVEAAGETALVYRIVRDGS